MYRQYYHVRGVTMRLYPCYLMSALLSMLCGMIEAYELQYLEDMNMNSMTLLSSKSPAYF